MTSDGWTSIPPQSEGCQWKDLNPYEKVCLKKPVKTINVAYLGDGEPLPQDFKPASLCDQHLEAIKTYNLYELED